MGLFAKNKIIFREKLMKRKLINYDEFKKMENESVSRVEKELIEAEELLATILETEKLELMFFNESEVVYKTINEDIVRANYKLTKSNLNLENIEELVIDEETEKNESKKLISDMIDNLLENKEEVAAEALNEYLNMPSVRRNLISEGFKVKLSKPTGRRSKLYHKKQPRSLVAKRIRNMMKTKRKRASLKNYLKMKTSSAKRRLKNITNPRARIYVVKTMKEWNSLTENVLGYVNHKEMGHVYKECLVEHNDKGDVVGVRVPTVGKVNEGKVLSFDWKTLDTEVKVLRNKGKCLTKNENFIKNVAQIKKYNNISDNNMLETSLENAVKNFPEIIYVTQDELSSMVKEALEMVGARNFDDRTCSFIAEGLLRTAHNAYSDRVGKITNLAGAAVCEECEDKYVEFRDLTNKFYKYLDESASADLKVFEDLVEALENLKVLAEKLGDKEIVAEASELLDECILVVNQEEEVDVQLAEFVANYLKNIYETNLGTEDWADDMPTMSVNGDHPSLSEKARKSYSPASDLEDKRVVDTPAPVSDGKSIVNDLDDEMRDNAWGNVGGDHVYPALNNPYIPDAMEFTMKGEKGVDKDGEDLGTNQGKDTWPNLQNPFAK
jgi:hypothetical protein